MKSKEDIKKELSKLEKKYNSERAKIIKNCNHNWVDNGCTSNKYNGTQYYKCDICGSEKGEYF